MNTPSFSSIREKNVKRYATAVIRSDSSRFDPSHCVTNPPDETRKSFLGEIFKKEDILNAELEQFAEPMIFLIKIIPCADQECCRGEF